MQYISTAFNYLLHFLKSCFRFGRTQYQPLSTTEANAANMTATVSSDVKRFLARFNAQYGTTHPVFFTGDDTATTTGASSSSSSSSSSRPVSLFEQVTKKAKQEFKLVLVYLHSEHHQNTAKFCRDVLCKESLKEYVDSNFIFFATDATSREGYLLTNSLQATTFPFLSVILCARGSPKAVCRIEGDIEVDTLITKLMEVHENTTPILVVFQNEENERVQRIQQREEQDRAYQEAMERDRQAELERQRKEEEERLRQEAARQREIEKANRLERLKQERRAIRSQFAEEPISTPGGGDVCLVRFKLPDGSQIQRKFSKTDKVQKLYEFIHVVNHADGSEPVVAYPQTKWKSNETSDLSNYEIATSFPKTVLDKEKTLEEAKCFPTASVFVREEVSSDE